ncbi:hypothetical protein Tco_1539318, partial [Tanacetum coccineum]
QKSRGKSQLDTGKANSSDKDHSGRVKMSSNASYWSSPSSEDRGYYKYLCLLDLELLDDELEKEEFIGLYWLINNKPELGQISHIEAHHWSSQAIKPRGCEEARKNDWVYFRITHTTSTNVSITDCHAGNPCEFICDPRAQNHSPMIEDLYGYDWQERGKQGKA